MEARCINLLSQSLRLMVTTCWPPDFFHGEYAISHGSESISLHNDDVHDVRCRDEVVTGEKNAALYNYKNAD